MVEVAVAVHLDQARAAIRRPSMIDASFSVVGDDRHVGTTRADSTPRFAAKPVRTGPRPALPLPVGERPLELGVLGPAHDNEPRRPAPAPYRSSERRLVRRGDHRGVLGEAEVVVRRERHDRRCRRERERGSAPERSKRDSLGGAPAIGTRWRHPGLGRRPRLASHGHRSPRRPRLAGTSTIRSISSHGDRQRRHEHHDVAERAQQHAAPHRRRAPPAAPSQPVAPAAPARRPTISPRNRTSRTGRVLC